MMIRIKKNIQPKVLIYNVSKPPHQKNRNYPKLKLNKNLKKHPCTLPNQNPNPNRNHLPKTQTQTNKNLQICPPIQL
jgi:hypothetical protein